MKNTKNKAQEKSVSIDSGTLKMILLLTEEVRSAVQRLSAGKLLNESQENIVRKVVMPMVPVAKVEFRPKAGDICQGQWRDGKFYHAIVKGRTADGKYDVVYIDGSGDMGVTDTVREPSIYTERAYKKFQKMRAVISAL
jgi:hypothetical protein